MKRTIGAKLLSIMLMISMLLAMCVVGVPTTMAASVIPSITPGESWSGSWSAAQDMNFLDLKISQTGLYELVITDYVQTNTTYVYIEDIETGNEIGYISEDIGSSPYVSTGIMLQAGHTYSMSISYYDDYWDPCAANMKIQLRKVTLVPTLLPTVAVNSSSVMFSLNEGDGEWFRFVPSVSGDYTMNFSSSVGAYVYMYDAATGEELDYRDTQYVSYGEWVNGTRAAFYLEANKEYYFLVSNYDSAVTSKISITKNNKAVSYITIEDADRTIDCWLGDAIWMNIDGYFYYRVTYKDGSSERLHYNDLCYRGLRMPYVMYKGDVVYPNNDTLLVAGNRAVVAYYDGQVSYSTIQVSSATDWLIEIDAGAIGEYDDCYFSNQGVEDDLGYYRIKIATTGTYNMYSADWDYFSSYSFEMLDAQNNPLVYNDGYALVAGQEYALSFCCTYEDYVQDNFEFYLKCEKQTSFPDTGANAWYSDAITYAVGRGIMSGYKNGKFGTADGIQRQDFLVMLARFDGVDLEYYGDQHGIFPDVGKNSYYEAAVTWGYECGIVTGYNNGYFGVGNKITREQLVTFMQRYAAYKGYDTSVSTSAKNTIANTYKDFGKVSAFSKDAVYWAVDNGVIKGKTATTIVPQGNAQRCEVAQIMYNIFINDVL